MRDVNSILKNLDWNNKRPFSWGSSPDADWRVIFSVTVSLIALASLLNAALFMRFQKGEFFAGEEPVVEEAPTLDTEKLRRTLEQYENMAAEFKKFTSGSANIIVDPSL